MLDPWGRQTLCYSEKEVGNLYNMYHTRNWLHRQAYLVLRCVCAFFLTKRECLIYCRYQHRVANIIEVMVTEALIEVDKVQQKNPNNEVLEAIFGFKGRLSDTIDDMAKYVKCTDSLIWKIIHSTTPLLQAARDIMFVDPTTIFYTIFECVRREASFLFCLNRFFF